MGFRVLSYYSLLPQGQQQEALHSGLLSPFISRNFFLEVNSVPGILQQEKGSMSWVDGV